MPDTPHRRYRYLDPRILQEIGPLELAAREIVEGVRVGIHKSPLRGFSTEFAQHRPYVPGDALKQNTEFISVFYPYFSSIANSPAWAYR